MSNTDKDKRIVTICDNVKWGREYSKEDIYLIERVVVLGHDDAGILGLAIYAFGRIYASENAYVRKNKSEDLLQHLGYEKPGYPRTAAIFALEHMDAVQPHLEFLVQESEREKAYHLSDDADDGYFAEKSIKRSEFINFVKKHAQN